MTTELIIPGRYHERYVFDFNQLRRGSIPKRVRHIQCTNCMVNHKRVTELATEAGDKGTQADEWWSIKEDGSWVKGKWWGNHYKCPKCGQEGNLPIDKPMMEEE